jgi:Flp pilus assembly protein TadB
VPHFYHQESRMKRFFERVSTKGETPQIASFSNMMTFYSLLFFLLTIPFVLIVALVWLTGVIGFSAWIFAALAVIAGFISWRLYRRWQQLKSRLAAQSSEVGDIVKEATKSGKDIEVTLLNGLLTFRYQGQQHPAPLQLDATLLALEAPKGLEVETVEAVSIVDAVSDPGRLRQELEGFLRLRDSGVISFEEFEAIKSRLM